MKMAGSGGVQPESSLMYLAKVLGYEVEYADFPKVHIMFYRHLVSN